MAFRVEISPRALADLDSISAYIRQQDGFESAEIWFNEIFRAIAGLGKMPQRCPVSEESRHLGQKIRVLLHGPKKGNNILAYSVPRC